MKTECDGCGEVIDKKVVFDRFKPYAEHPEYIRYGECNYHPECLVKDKKGTPDEESLRRCYPELGWDENFGDEAGVVQ